MKRRPNQTTLIVGEAAAAAEARRLAELRAQRRARRRKVARAR